MENEIFFTDNVFSLSPMAKRIYLEPGQIYSDTIRITNPLLAENTLHFKIEAVPYSVTNENYDADFNTETKYSQIANWITLDQDEGYLEPNNSTSITYHINVPTDAPGGGQYCAFSVYGLANEDFENSDEGAAAVNNIVELSSIIYAQVSGSITRAGEILENKVPVISFKTPVTTSLSYQNTGNIHQDATVIIKATNAITGKPITLHSSNSDSNEDSDSQDILKFNEVVMPDSTRYASHQVEGLSDLGIYKISQTISFSGEQNTTEHLVFVTPLWFVCLVIATIGLTVIFFIFKIKKRHSS